MEWNRIITLVTYAIELAIAALLLWYDQRLFFLYFFFCFVVGLDMKYRDVRKLILACEMLERLRIRVILRKLNVTEEEITKARKELTPEEDILLAKLLSDVGLKN